MIDAKCRTNLDEYQRLDWPTKFVALPRVGDRVESQSGPRARLKVVSVCHSMVFVASEYGRDRYAGTQGDWQPIAIIELNN